MPFVMFVYQYFQLKYKFGFAAKLQNRGHMTAKMQVSLGPVDSSVPLTAADFGMNGSDEASGGPTVAAATAGGVRGKNLFADSTVPSFFRRPSFSPDGVLFVSPTGIYRPSNINDTMIPSGHSQSILPAASFCTHIFSRDHLSSPIVSLTGLEDPSVAVRFSPIMYKPVRIHGETTPRSMIPGEFRYVSRGHSRGHSRLFV